MSAALVNWSLWQFQSLVIILLRVGPVLFLMPVLGSRNLPAPLKVCLALSVSLVLLPVVPLSPRPAPEEPLEFASFLVVELLIGFILALSVKIVLAAVQLGGELISFQMGLAMANVVDPQSGVSAPILSQFFYLVSLILFLAADGHHWFFRGLAHSFLLLPPGEIHLQEGLYRHLLNLMSGLFVTAIQLAAPVMAVLLFTQVSMGILAKAVPQINILITSFPLTIGIGLVFLILSLDLLIPHLRALFQESGRGLVHTLLPLMKR